MSHRWITYLQNTSLFFRSLSLSLSSLPNDGVHGSGEENEHLGIEEGKMAESVLPANDSSHHEQTTAG